MRRHGRPGPGRLPETVGHSNLSELTIDVGRRGPVTDQDEEIATNGTAAFRHSLSAQSGSRLIAARVGGYPRKVLMESSAAVHHGVW